MTWPLPTWPAGRPIWHEGFPWGRPVGQPQARPVVSQITGTGWPPPTGKTCTIEALVDGCDRTLTGYIWLLPMVPDQVPGGCRVIELDAGGWLEPAGFTAVTVTV